MSRATATLSGQCRSTLLISCFSSAVGALAGYPCGDMTTWGRFSVGSSDASLQVLNCLFVPGLMFPSHRPPTAL